MRKQIECGVSLYPVEVSAGQNVSAVASSPRRGWLTPRVFHFSTDGGVVRRTVAEDSCIVRTDGLAPGTYTLKVHVYQGADPWHQADAEARFKVTEVEHANAGT